MSFSPYLPPNTSGEAATVFSLLRVLADPAAAQETLKRMHDEKQAIDDAAAKQVAAKNAADKLHAAAQEKLEAAHALSSEAEGRQTAAQRKESSLVDMDRRLTAREAALTKAEDELKTHKDEMREAFAAQDAKARAQAARELQLNLREEKLRTSEKAHKEWIASLKPPNPQ
jgi:hypothetical protein